MDQEDLQPPMDTEAEETELVEFEARCPAMLTERWRSRVPAGLSDEDLRGMLLDAMGSNDGCEFLYQDADDEHDREITEIIRAVEPDEQIETEASAPATPAPDNTVWVLRRSDNHTDGEISLWADDDSAYEALAEHVRDRWDNVRFDFDGVPDVAPPDDREAVAIYYGTGLADESHVIYPDTVGRRSPKQ